MSPPKKQPSGAANRQAARVRAEEERRKEAARRLDSPGSLPSHLQHFAKVGPPPDGDPIKAVSWANQICSQLLWEVCTDGQITAEQRWRFGADLVAKLAMTHAKAIVSKRIAALEHEDIEENDEEGLEPYPEDNDDHRPSTARSRGQTGGEESLSGSLSDSQEEDDGGNAP